MKLIIDANCTFHCNSEDEDGAPILKGLLSGNLILCICQRLKREILLTPLGEIYRDLSLAGKIIEPDQEDIEKLIKSINNMCKSNDQHILALAIASGSRLLFSHDKPLHDDFLNQNIVPSPKGKIYQNKNHRKLLI